MSTPPVAPPEGNARSRYSLNPAVTFVQVSDDEIVARGGHLDGFSLIISDETGRGLAAPLVAALTQGGTLAEIHSAIAGTHDVTIDEVDRFVDELHRSGAALRAGHQRASLSDWLAFARFGEVSPPAVTHDVVIAGGPVADALVTRLGELGVRAQRADATTLDDLERFAQVDAPPPEHPDRADLQANGHGTPDSESDIAPAARLVVAGGLSLDELYALNERAVQARAPVLYLQLTGVEYGVGPYVVPAATACFWEFERQRARAAFSYAEYAVLVEGNGGRTVRPAAVAEHALVAAATPFLVELAMLGESSLAGQVVRGRATTAESARHAVMRLPRCPVCMPLRPPIRNPLF